MIQWLLEKITLNRTLIVLGVVAIVLGSIAYVVVFYGGGTYVVSSPLPTSTAAFDNGTSTASSTAFADGSSTASSTGSDAASSTASSAVLANFASTYATPPMSWSEGYDTIAVTGANLSGSQLTLTLQVQMGSVAECVPLNLRLVTDESGDTEPPLNPSFSFGENGTCIGLPGQTYAGQQVVFTVDPASMPLSFTTGGTSNKYFELSTNPDGTITIAPPPTQG